MNESIRQIDAVIQRRKLLPPGAKLLVAVSGGVDSMVLLHVLHALSLVHGWQLHVAHFNHQLRGGASDADERLVRTSAAALKLPVFVGGENVKQFASDAGISIEMAARDLRHRFLAQTATEIGCKRIALAHHADDQLELFFLRLQRGSGVLAGMKWASASPANPEITLIRPFLELSKEEVQSLAKPLKVKFREDRSNASAEFRRNQIRSEVIPVLKRQNPPLFRTILRSMEIAGAESECVSEYAQTWRRRKTEPFAALHSAVQRRVILDQLREMQIPPDFELVERLREKVGDFISVSAEWMVSLSSNGELKKVSSASPAFQGESLFIPLGNEGSSDLGGRKVSWIVEKAGKEWLKKQDGIEFFDADKVGTAVELRFWRPGDRFQPIGFGHNVKLQDCFVNAKVGAEERRTRLIAVAENGEIFWVEGLRISDRFKLDQDTVRQLKWIWKTA